MEIAINEEIGSRSDYRDLIARANEVLKATVGRAPHPPKAKWGLSATRDSAQPVSLELEYFDQTLITPFTTAELAETNELRYRFCRIWGQLIRQSNRENARQMVRLLGDMRETSRTLEEA